METGLGKLQLSPDDFWNMSLVEFFAACAGFAEFHSGGKPPPLKQSDLQEMMELYPD
jgi:uncharacterized phage protein (TIGR02216 family)